MKSNLELLVQNAFKAITDSRPEGGFTKADVRDVVEQNEEFTTIVTQVEQLYPHWDLRYSVMHRVSDRIGQIVKYERDRYGNRKYFAVRRDGHEYVYCLVTSLTQPMVRTMMEHYARVRESWGVKIEQLEALEELFVQHPAAKSLGDFYDEVAQSEPLRLFA